jgi:hypothetical protein
VYLSGGLCQLPSCRRSVFAHAGTQTPLTIGQKAHIVAFETGGPRGRSGQRPADIHEIGNLMLLCPDCHIWVDKDPKRFTITALRDFKKRHEQDVRETHRQLRSNAKDTAVIRLIAPIGGKPAEIPEEEMRRAIFPNRLKGQIIDISLADSALAAEDNRFYAYAQSLIETRVRNFYIAAQSHTEPAQHLSLFGLAPIPLLVQFGHAIGRDLHAEVYNRHHKTEDWRWNARAPAARFEVTCLREGSDMASVALMVSCSGAVHAENLPMASDPRFWIYHIAPVGVTPSKNVLRSKRSLVAFRDVYEQFRGSLRERHAAAKSIHLFAAAPPAIAITLGRELITKVDPALVIYDWRRDHYIKTIEVNKHDRRRISRRDPG